MKAVILAAGEGTRMRPLTLERPKPLLTVLDKPLIHYTFSALPDVVDEVVVVVKYKGEMIREYLGNEYVGKRVQYVTQEMLDGTGGALWAARTLVEHEGPFMVLMADDIYTKFDLDALTHFDNAMLVFRTSVPEQVGSVRVEDGVVVGIVEGGAMQGASTINTGAYVVPQDVFMYERVPKASGSHEYGLPQTMLAAYPRGVRAVYAKEWVSVSVPDDLVRATHVLTQG